VPKRSYDPGLESYTLDQVVVIPKYKLAFCPIAKNACTQFYGMFRYINTGEVKERDVSVYGSSKAARFGLDPKNLTKANGWKWAVFLRDPLERYLSAFKSKCIVQERWGKDCLPHSTLVAQGASESEQVQEFEKGVRINFNDDVTQSNMVNVHWAEQSNFCGGLGNLKGYDFVGRLDGDVNEQVQSMLKMAHVQQSAAIAEKFFPKRGPASIMRNDHITNAQDTYADFFKNGTVEGYVRHLYRHDVTLYKSLKNDPK